MTASNAATVGGFVIRLLEAYGVEIVFDFEGLIRGLNHVHYMGPLTVEWEDPMMDREHGAAEAADFTHGLDFAQSGVAFDAAFGEPS